MYESFFGLTERPFELTPNPKYLFLTARQREALSTLQYGLFSARPVTLLLGEAGTGKTTLIHAALASERCSNVRCVYVDNPVLTIEDFVRLLALRFDLGADVNTSKSIMLERLYVVLRERRARGEITALVVDESQSLSTALLEELRLLANIETATEKLLPLVLAGQPELAVKLELNELRQLKQRITLRCELAPFDLGDTANYIASRIRTAGGTPVTMFSREAVTLIHHSARAIPRTINTICDNALLSAMALGRRRVEQDIVMSVCRDLRIEASPAPEVARMADDEADSANSRSRVSAETGHAEPEASPKRPPRTSPARKQQPAAVGATTWPKRAPFRNQARIITE